MRTKDFLKNYDFSFFIGMFALFTFGVFNLYSATFGQETGDLFRSQIFWFSISVIIGFFISLIHPKSFFEFAYPIYFLNCLALLFVLILGKVGMGAQRWLVIGPLRIQPSEFMKISLVFALAKWFSNNSSVENLGIKDLVIPFLISFIPATLIFLQPDLGTGGILILIFSVIAYYKKLEWRSIFKLLGVGVFCGILMFQFALKDYQKRRITTFLNPYQDAKGSGYNAIQSEIAIGSGRIVGKGYKNSSQASLNFLPENHTDFVFSIFSEEHGLIGVILLLGIYLIIMLRFLWLAKYVPDMFQSVMTVGLMAIFFWHTFVNIGMVSGILPIVGLPLPLMSYGGSSLLTFGIAFGMATSMSNARSIFH